MSAFGTRPLSVTVPPNAFHFYPGLPSPRIALQGAPHSGREGKVGERGRDWRAEGRFHPFVSFLYLHKGVGASGAIGGPKIVKGGSEGFHLVRCTENFFHSSSVQGPVSASVKRPLTGIAWGLYREQLCQQNWSHQEQGARQISLGLRSGDGHKKSQPYPRFLRAPCFTNGVVKA